MTPSFNDKMFEVMAVFGTSHLALSMAEKATRVNAISNHAMQCHRTRVILILMFSIGSSDRRVGTGPFLGPRRPKTFFAGCCWIPDFYQVTANSKASF